MAERDAERADRILDAAAELLARWGYRKVTVDEVVRRAGKGTVYLHWRSRDELLFAVLLREGVATFDELVRGMRADPTEVALHRYVRTVFLLAHIRARRADPGEDLISKLTVAEADGRVLTDGEIIGFAGLLLIAGHITTTALLGNSIQLLDEHPEIGEHLQADRELVPQAVEEFLRVRSPFPRVSRRSTRELILGGVQIPQNYMVFPWLASANRDARQFAAPEVVDIRRKPNQHLAFGKGIHFCIGAPLARLEAKVALNRLLDRYRRIHVTGGEFFDATTMTAAKQLPVLAEPH